MTTRPSIKLGKSVADKMQEINQDSSANVVEERTIQNEVVERTQEKQEIKISLDSATLETLKQKHNLVEKQAKASFYWKSSNHKALRNLAIDTDKSAEEYLAEWAAKGLEEARRKFYKEI